MAAGIRLQFRKDLIEAVILIGGDAAVHRALLPENLREFSRIDSLDARQAVFLHKLQKRHIRAEIARLACRLVHNQRVHPRPVRLTVVKTDAVIADQRIGHTYRLSRVRRIRKNLRIAGHCRVEHDLADDIPVRTDPPSRKNCSVFEYQKCFHRFPLFIRLCPCENCCRPTPHRTLLRHAAAQHRHSSRCSRVPSVSGSTGRAAD